MRQRLLVVFLAVGSALGCGGKGDAAKESPAVVDAGPTKPPERTCDATHRADGPACVPQYDACGPRDVAKLGGGCEPVGIPTCGEGFVNDGSGGCKTSLPTTPCAAGSIALPGSSTCEPIAACADVVDATVFVDASASGGDGSRAKPFSTIGAAIASASAGAVVSVAAGTYVEDVVIDKPIRVVGRCPTLVTIQGVATDSSAGAVLITAKASLERVSVTGPASGVIADKVSGITFDSLRVFGAALQTGVWIRDGANALVKRTVVDGATNFGIVVSGAIARVERSHVLGTRLGTTAVGVRVNPHPMTFAPAELTVVGSLLEKNENANAQAISAKMTIESSVVRDGVPIAGEWGVGVMSSNHPSIKIPGDVTIRTSIIEGNSYMGVLVRDSKLLLDRSVVRDTKLEAKDKNYGRGVVVQGVTSLTTLDMRASVVERNQETGVDVNGQATAKISDSIIRDTRPNGATGTGLFGELITKTGPIPQISVDHTLFSGNAKGGAISAGKLAITRSRFSHNATFSLVSRGGDVSLGASLIEDSEADAAGQDGHGVLGLPDKNRVVDAKLTLDDVAIRRARKAGVSMFGGKLTIARSSIRGIEPEKADPVGGIAVAIESQRMVDATSLEMDATLLDSISGAAILVNGGPAKLSNVHIRDVRLALDGQFGDGVLVAGVYYVGGGLRTASLELSGSWIEKTARTGVALFGGTLAVSSTFLTCNTIALDVEAVAAWDGMNYVEHEFTVEDRGGNVCGCDVAAPCLARSTNLKPAEPHQQPKL